MKVTLTHITLGEATSANQTFTLAWKFTTESDPAYRSLPNVTVNPSGAIVSPSPYIFTTEGSTNKDIDIKAVNTCDGSFFLIKVVAGLPMCCPSGYTLSPDGLQCSQTLTTPPTIIQSGVCVACSQFSPNYGNQTKFWSAINYNGDLSDSNFVILSTPYWRGNPPGSGTGNSVCGTNTPGSPPSPVNRQGVWLDSNCDGVKNGLSGGAALQFTWVINTPVAKTVLIGMSGDNNFTLNLNGSTIVDRPTSLGSNNFNFLYLFPLQLISGSNFIGASFVGDGSTSDMGCLMIMDNDPATIPGITDDSQIQYLFKTSQMIGAQPIDIASCPSGYVLDTSGGSGNYNCIQINTVASTPC